MSEFMSDVLLPGIVDLAIVSLFVTALKIKGVVEVRGSWALASVMLLVCYNLALSTHNEVIPVATVFPDAKFNWGGKVLGILLSLSVLVLLIRFKENFKPADAGFSLKQNPLSTRPAMLGLGLFGLFQILLANLLSGSSYDAETLLYQASMPGLDEELMFRGVLLYFLSLAIPSSRTRIFGAEISAAGLIIVAYFGLGHGLVRYGGEWYFSALTILVTGLYGFVLLWFRERTGNLVFPIVAHNVVNVVAGFKFDF